MLLDKIDIRPIVRGHFQTLRDNSAFGSKSSKEDAVVFLGFPVIAAASVVLSGFRFRVDAVNGFLNLFSILTGLLLNVLVLIISLSGARNVDAVDPSRRQRLIREMFSNICFSVLIAVAVVCVALFALSYMRSVQGAVTGPGATVLLVGLTVNFVLSLLMILKRMYVLLDKDLKTDNQHRAA